MMIIEKPWGSIEILIKTGNYDIKRIIVNDGSRLSRHYHNYKEETLIYPDGRIEHIPPKTIHRIKGPIVLIEVSHGDDADIIRLEDDYGRS